MIKKIIVGIRGKYTTNICPYCGEKTSKRKDRKMHIQKNNLKHMPYGGNKIIEKLDEIYLGVDEYSFSGYDMVLIIMELKTKQVLAVLDGITKEKLEKLIWSIPLKYHLKIKGPE